MLNILDKIHCDFANSADPAQLFSFIKLANTMSSKLIYIDFANFANLLNISNEKHCDFAISADPAKYV